MRAVEKIMDEISMLEMACASVTKKKRELEDRLDDLYSELEKAESGGDDGKDKETI